MRKILAILAAVAVLPAPAFPAEQAVRKGSVVVIPLKGEVTQAQFYFLRRTLKKAESGGAAAFIIDMDTYGGRLDAAVDMLGALMKSTIPTITYVDSNAGSAGAMIALSTKKIYMAPVSAIGAAAPVTGEGQDLQETMKAKTESYFSGYFRSAAERNGYNPELAEAFINKEKEVKIGDTVINAKGTLLTLSAQEAVREYNGKPLLASGIAANIDELCKEAGLSANDIVRLEPSGFEQLAQWVTALAPFFLLGGIIGAYLEFKSPGFGVAGVLSALCFLIFFTGHYIAGLTGFEVMAVFAAGLLLVLIELIFFPGVVLLATIGTALMLGSLLFAMVDLYPGEPFSAPALSFDALLRPMANLGIALVLAMLAITLLARFLPALPFFNRLVLSTRSSAGPSVAPPAHALPESRVQIGDEGTARTILRPAGKAEFGAALLDVITDGEFLDPGDRVKVTAIEGDRVIVRKSGQI